jgi:hypothetical protein
VIFATERPSQVGSSLDHTRGCQRSSASPQGRPSVLPGGGHEFSPLVAIGSPHRCGDPVQMQTSLPGRLQTEDRGRRDRWLARAEEKSPGSSWARPRGRFNLCSVCGPCGFPLRRKERVRAAIAGGNDSLP